MSPCGHLSRAAEEWGAGCKACAVLTLSACATRAKTLGVKLCRPPTIPGSGCRAVSADPPGLPREGKTGALTFTPEEAACGAGLGHCLQPPGRIWGKGYLGRSPDPGSPMAPCCRQVRSLPSAQHPWPSPRAPLCPVGPSAEPAPCAPGSCLAPAFLT